jgi:predicted pyridoxine 5'-phosphate oxidase superfamily flavin-nucleotide-binding protein
VSVALREIARCFEGEIPSIMATADAAGVPNLGQISQVFLVDDQHVAISNQFLGKSIRNLKANPLVVLVVIDPDTLCSFKLFARFLRSESSGPTFETVKRSIDAIAALSGMSDVFALKGVEVFRVLAVEPVPTRGSSPA